MTRRRELLIGAGGIGAAASAGCLEEGDDEEREPEPPASVSASGDEVDVFMVEAFDYLNGHREEPPEASFDPSELKQPWQYYVESIQYQME